MKRLRTRKRRIESELNITNLVDVVFTLLIIFMITAPMMTLGVQVDLPKADAQNIEVEQSIQIAITERNEIFIDEMRANPVEFRKKFAEYYRNRTEVPVFINADKKVPYGLVIRVIADIQLAGVVKLGFLTQPITVKG